VGEGRLGCPGTHQFMLAVAFLKLFSWGEITKGTISVSPRDGQAWQLPRSPTYEEQYDVPGIIVNMVPVNSGFHK